MRGIYIVAQACLLLSAITLAMAGMLRSDPVPLLGAIFFALIALIGDRSE